MKYQHEIKKLPKSEIEITVTIPFTELTPFIEKAAKKISQGVEIPGFRKGNAPLDLIKQKVGEMKVLEEGAALAVEKSYVEIINQEKLEPLGSPKVDFEKLAADNEFTYKATVALIPEVKVGDYKSIKVKENEIVIKDEEIEKTIEELRNQRATEVIENKAVAKGDKVEVDFDVFRDNVPIENGAQKKYPLIIGSDHFIPGFEDNLIGLKTNEEKEFELKFPEEYHNKNLAGKPAKFKVKIIAVYKRTLPELNQEFAKSLGQESMEKLKEQIKHNLEHEQHHKEEERLEIEIIDQLIGKSEFGELPDTLVTAETNKMLQELESNLSMQGLKMDEYLKHLNKTQEQLKLEFAPQALKRVKSALVLRSLFFEEKMEVKPEEIEAEINKAKQMYQQNPDIIKNLDTPQYRDYLQNMLGNQKVIDLLKTTCVEREAKNPKVEHNH